jgi:hypothetical protein
MPIEKCRYFNTFPPEGAAAYSRGERIAAGLSERRDLTYTTGRSF